MSINDDQIRYGCRLADPQALEKWRQRVEEEKAEAAREHRRDAREQRRATEASEIETLRNELHAEIAAVRVEVDRRADIHIKAIGEVIGQVRQKIADHVDQAIRDIQNQLFVTIERRFGELMGRIDAIAPDATPRAKGEFRFANERQERDDEVVELPNPLPPHRAIIN